MSTDRSPDAENRAERERLRALVTTYSNTKR